MRLTLLQLNEHAEKQRRLKEAEDLLVRLREKAEPGAQNITGMPRAPGVSDRVGKLASEIADIEHALGPLQAEVEESRPQVQTFIDEIADVQLRTIMSLRFLKGMEWTEVAEIIGGGNTAAGVSMQCYRYLYSF